MAKLSKKDCQEILWAVARYRMTVPELRVWLRENDPERAKEMSWPKKGKVSICKRCGREFSHNAAHKRIYCGMYCSSQALRADYSRYYELSQEGFTHKQIAEKLGGAKSTVPSKILRHKIRHGLLTPEEQEKWAFSVKLEQAKQAANHA
ncbi:MAG: hypothetical protein ACR2RF_32240 [Geminicoccaceae bacterium]